MIALGGEHDDAHVTVGVDRGEHLAQRVAGGDVVDVDRRMVEHDLDDRPPPIDAQSFVSHDAPPRRGGHRPHLPTTHVCASRRPARPGVDRGERADEPGHRVGQRRAAQTGWVVPRRPPAVGFGGGAVARTIVVDERHDADDRQLRCGAPDRLGPEAGVVQDARRVAVDQEIGAAEQRGEAVTIGAAPEVEREPVLPCHQLVVQREGVDPPGCSTRTTRAPRRGEHETDERRRPRGAEHDHGRAGHRAATSAPGPEPDVPEWTAAPRPRAASRPQPRRR